MDSILPQFSLNFSLGEFTKRKTGFSREKLKKIENKKKVF